MKCRILSEWITEVKENQVFVFGSNLSGRHGKGAAKQAMKYGAKYGEGEGLFGRTYALPTVDYHVREPLSIGDIKTHVDRFIKVARKNPKLEFLVTEVGCGLAHYKAKDIAPLFRECLEMENICLPKKFITILEGESNS